MGRQVPGQVIGGMVIRGPIEPDDYIAYDGVNLAIVCYVNAYILLLYDTSINSFVLLDGKCLGGYLQAFVGAIFPIRS